MTLVTPNPPSIANGENNIHNDRYKDKQNTTNEDCNNNKEADDENDSKELNKFVYHPITTPFRIYY